MDYKIKSLIRLSKYLLISILFFFINVQITNAEFKDDIDDKFKKSTLLISATKHSCYFFNIYLAITNEERRRGLMYVRKLPLDSGMMFIYPTNRILSIWMKNTYIPLDIIFFKEDGHITNIYKNAKPLTLNSRQSSRAVKYVLELNGGVTEKLFIDENSRILLLDYTTALIAEAK
tara:strand:- start:41 stop:565 length:525 start_codon:yes stop_codon:yes gene_type:complete